MRRLLFSTLLLFTGFINTGLGQDSTVVKGNIIDGKTGKPLVKARLLIKHGDSFIISTKSGQNGSFEIKIKQGSYLFIPSYIGYVRPEIRVEANTDTLIRPIVLSSEGSSNRHAQYDYYPPLFRVDRFTQGEIITNEEIMRLPLKN